MAPPRPVVSQFNLYTLACRSLLDRWDAFRQSTRDDYQICLDSFDRALEATFIDPPEVHDVVADFCRHLGNQARRLSNKKVAKIFLDIIKVVKSKAHSWHYQEDLKEFQEQGRRLAEEFYANSPFPLGQDKKEIWCEAIPNCCTKDESEKNPLFSYHREYIENNYGPMMNNIILVRFDPNHSIKHYLAFSTFFAHEYISHIYANDEAPNAIFNDGWLIYATQIFLTKNLANPGQVELSLNQTTIFTDFIHMYLRDREPEKGGYDFAVSFEACFPNLFDEITFRLSACGHRRPIGSRPTEFIEKLQRVLRKYRKKKPPREVIKKEIRCFLQTL